MPALTFVVALIAAAIVASTTVRAILTLFGEIRRISALAGRTSGLRALDCWGRP